MWSQPTCLYSFNLGLVTNQFLSNGNVFGGGLGAHIVVEYDFSNDLDLPYTVSLDSRPMFNFVNYYSGSEFSMGVSIRYTC